jgi:hypothetical protein
MAMSASCDDKVLRLSRFGDWTPLEPLCQFGDVPGRRPFYAGPDVASRMASIREMINYIRIHWNEYPRFMSSVRELMTKSGVDLNAEGDFGRRAEALLCSSKNWADQSEQLNTDDYSAIRLYTSFAGYNQIFRTINEASREDDLIKRQEALEAAAFLVELLTIDLFNYRGANPAADNFTGCVYRGMCVSGEQLKEWSALANGEISQRYLAIPLAMVSASDNRDKALTFAVNEAARISGYPVLWVIHVAGLRPELLALYVQRFPASIVTSICAVPINDLSDYPDEQEVLLRGPFFQLVRLCENGVRYGTQQIPVIEVLMLNSNRDHISSVFLDDSEADSARNLFRALVQTERATLCAQLAEEYGLSADAKAYASIRVQEEASVDRLLRR